MLGTGAPTPDRAGTFKMREAAIEGSIPLIADKLFIKVLNFETGYRRTEFETSSKQSYGSWKGGGEWQPIQTLRFRGMVQKAARAPNVNELFAPVVTGLSNLAVDPCQGTRVNKGEANTAGTLSNLCRLTGVPLSEIGSLPAPSSGQINNASGGNPNLGPEEAKTKTLGFVWEPAPRLMVSLDYYKIDIEKAVSSPSTTDILDGCYSAAQNPGLTLNAACGMIGRNTINGTFNGVESSGVLTPQSNLGTQSTSGWDLNAAYRFNANQVGLESKWGSFDVSFNYNQVQEYKFRATPTSIERDCLGYYSVACNNVVNAPVFKRKFNQRTNWSIGSFVVGYNWRYMSAVNEEPGGQDFLPAFAHIKAFNYLDLNGVYNFNKNIRINLSIKNATDKKPPIVGGTIGGTGPNSGNTFPQTYDAVGRYFTVGATVKF